MASPKAKGKTLSKAQLGGEPPIPPEFVAAMERQETEQAVPNDVPPEALSDLIVESKVETNRTDERVRRTVKKKSGNITLNSFNVSNEGLPVQTVRVMLPTGTATLDSSATAKVAVKDLGNGWSIEETSTEGTFINGVFTPAVFDQKLVENRQSFVVPDKFRGADATTHIESTTAIGEVATPTALGAEGKGVIDSKAERVDTFKVRVTDTSVVGTPPTTNIDYGVSQGQLVTVSDSIVADNAAAPTVTATTISLDRQVLGGGKAEFRVGTVAAVFDGKMVRDDGPTAIIKSEVVRHLAGFKEEQIATIAAGTSTTPTTVVDTLTGTIASEVQRVDATKIRTTDTVVTGTNTSLVGVEFQKETGEVSDFTESIVPAGTVGAAINGSGFYSTVRPLNTSWSVLTTRKTVGAALIAGRTWTLTRHVSLPRVLTLFSPYSISYKAFLQPYGNPTSISYGSVNYPAYGYPRYVNPGGGIAEAGFNVGFIDYSGVRAVTVNERWWSTAQTELSGTLLSPQSFSWWTPFGSGSVPECLHSAILINGTTGTTHPKFAYSIWNYSFAATSPSGLGGTIILSSEQRPYEGGFLIRTESITI